MAKATKLMTRGVCNGSLTDNYSLQRYKECGAEGKLYRVSLYGASLGGEKCGYTMMCSNCVARTKAKWPSVTIK